MNTSLCSRQSCAVLMTLAAAVTNTCVANETHAQTPGAPRTGVAVSPTMMTWSFKTPVAQDSFGIRGVTQFAIPVAVVIPIGRRWTLDASGAYQVGRVALTGSDGVDRDWSLSGATDIKLRLVGRVSGDRLRLTLGLNAPTGSTKLTGTDIDAIRVIGAPALRLPVPSLGNGFGASVGAVFATQVAAWATALGASYEMRGSYSPIEASIAGAALPTDLNPADALHFTVGADRIVRAGRVSFLVGADLYGKDELKVSRAGSAPVSGTYQLGPSITALTAIEFGVRGFREFDLTLSNRYRSAFRDVDGGTVKGSSGNFFDANLRAISGTAAQVGILFGADAHFDSGQEVDNSIATAAISSAGVLLGVSIPFRTYAWQPYVRGQFGSIDAGRASTSLSGFSVGVTLTAR